LSTADKENIYRSTAFMFSDKIYQQLSDSCVFCRITGCVASFSLNDGLCWLQTVFRFKSSNLILFDEFTHN